MSRTVTLASYSTMYAFQSNNVSLQMHPWKALSYLEKLIIIKQPRREGMRSDKQTRILDTTKKTHAARSVSVEGPEQWNSLPDDIRIEDYKKFKSKLKMHLYEKAFLNYHLCKAQLIKLHFFLVHYIKLHVIIIIIIDGFCL